MKWNLLLMQYNSPFILINAICIFLLLEKVNIKNKNITKRLSFVSSCAFGVYIIHCHPLVYDYVVYNMLEVFKSSNSLMLFIVVITSIVAIYTVCILIESIRKYFFKLLKIDKLVQESGDWIDKIIYFEK